MDATRARRSPGTGVWLTSEWRWWRSKQEGGGPEAGGALPTVQDAVVKLYRYVVGDGDEALSTCVVMSLLRIDGSELEHVDTRCCESNCRMISYYFLWSVLTYIWFIYNTTLFISSLNLKKTLHWWFLLNSTEHDVCSDLTDRWSSVCMCREVCVIIFSPTEPRPNRTSG